MDVLPAQALVPNHCGIMQNGEPRISNGIVSEAGLPDFRSDHTTEPRWQGGVDDARQHIVRSAKHPEVRLLFHGLVFLNDRLEVFTDVVTGRDRVPALHDRHQ